jgi:uncharacterized membrane protein (UPF0127 family)
MTRDLAATMLLAATLFASCHAQSTPAAAATGSSVASSGPTVTLPDGFVVRAEIAADDDTRTQGLMYRDRVAPGTGMLFMFPQAGDFPFWMKNTLVPLDMIWINDQKTIVVVETDVPPCKADPCASYPPAYPANSSAHFVLELGAGEAAKHGVAKGKSVTFTGLDKVMVR